MIAIASWLYAGVWKRVARRRPLAVIVGLTLVLVALVGGCAAPTSDSSSDEHPLAMSTPDLATVKLKSIAITPTPSSLYANVTQALTAIGTYTDGTTQNLTSTATWSSSNANIATVSAAGVVMTVAPGTATISAASGTITGKATVKVLVTLTSIAVTPPSTTLPANTTQTLTATGMYDNATTKNLTSTASWTSSNPAVATVSSAGVVLAIAAGTTTITASSSATGSLVSGTAAVTVSTARLTSVSVTPVTKKIPALNTTFTFTATGIFSDGTKLPLATGVTWASSNPTVATIASTGTVTTVSGGTVAITATVSGIQGKATLTVGTATLSSVSVTPLTLSVPLGLTPAFLATGTYSDGTTMDLTPVATWASATAAVATVSNSAGSQGIATTLSTGTAKISATVSGKKGTATLTVTSATLAAIAVTPVSPRVPSGTTAQLTATGTYSNGTTQNITGMVTWTSSAPGVAIVSNAPGTAGTAYAMALGTSTVTATDPTTGIASTTTLTVSGAILTSLTIAPASASIPVGFQQQFTATGTYSDTSTANLTTSVLWSAGSATVASISNAAGSAGLATALGAGSTSITALLNGISATSTLNATGAILRSITVTPNSSSLPLGASSAFVATGTYSDGSTQSLTALASWSSSGGVSVSNAAGSNGVATATALGPATVTATDPSTAIAGSAQVTVVAPVLVAITVAPGTAFVPVGMVQSFIATGTYSDGSTQDLSGTAAWSSSVPAVAAIAAGPCGNVIVTADAPGVTTIAATDPASGVSGSAQTTVTPDPVQTSVLQFQLLTSSGAVLTPPVALSVTVSATGFSSAVTSDCAGNYSIVVPSGPVSVVVGYGSGYAAGLPFPDYLTLNANLDLTGNVSTQITIPTTTVTVLVTDTNHAPVPGAQSSLTQVGIVAGCGPDVVSCTASSQSVTDITTGLNPASTSAAGTSTFYGIASSSVSVVAAPPAGSDLLAQTSTFNATLSTTLNVQLPWSGACVPPPSGLVSWWTGNGNALDTEGVNEGTAVGNVTYGPGMVGQAFVFDGQSRVLASTTGMPIGGADRTIEMWVNLDTLGSQYVEEALAQYGTLGNGGETFIVLTRGTPQLIFSQWGGAVVGGAMSVGTWTHVAVTSTSGVIALYENGQQVADQAIGFSTPAGTSFYIGGYGPAPDAVEALTGMADEVSVYDRALLPAEIASIYGAGTAGKCYSCAPGASQCSGAEVVTCGPDGTWGSPTACPAASCTDGPTGSSQTTASACTDGSCSTGSTTSCGQYTCGGATCKTACSTNSDCIAGDTCSGTICVAGGTATFGYTGAPQTFVVPANATQVTITAAGASGGADCYNTAGGLGASVTATMAVTPGESLAVYVGGAGGRPGQVNGYCTIAGLGGFNGGAPGGPVLAATPTDTGAGGGGASDVRLGGTALSNRVVAAAGGGGGGAGPALGTGGAGGASTGGTGGAGYGGGGVGGTDGAGGAGGFAGGTAGTLGGGGTGGGANGYYVYFSGGGGGGGYYGGGGGGADILGGGGAGGGGGGSSYAASTSLSTAMQAGVQAGNGQVTITWSAAPLPAPSGTATFGFTGATQSFVVPAGVTEVSVAALGAQGDGSCGSGPAGLGGSTTGTIPVTPGETLVVVVGGAGTSCAGPGGFNGGGPGGTGGRAGGDGGGASDVRQGGSALANRVIVAGGSGGLAEGNGGGSTGQAGEGGSGGGGGGTQSMGGGSGLSCGGCGNGALGALGAGGAGGAGCGGYPSGGGGGGGGYYGGGGGGGHSDGPCGGGGGGSSYAGPSATGVTLLQGVQAGDGQVVITWGSDMPPTDPYFSDVVLLMHFDGPNGSTSFQDIAGNTVTPNGMAQISTQTYAFGGASAYFDQASAYLTVPNSPGWNLTTGDSTVEMWIKPSITTEVWEFLMGQSVSGNPNDNQWVIGLQGPQLDVQNNGGGSNVETGSLIVANTWQHVAVVRSSGITYMYVNGLLSAEGSQNPYTDSPNPLYIGAGDFVAGVIPTYLYGGYIDELRITNGVARYTANFTPPTGEFPNSGP